MRSLPVGQTADEHTVGQLHPDAIAVKVKRRSAWQPSACSPNLGLAFRTLAYHFTTDF
ncbi:MAG TPA: hypothetical protein VJG32_23615 [Anaerolineae bacterium]|nr:hypothetical protein [Anaerolineae bacterium]